VGPTFIPSMATDPPYVRLPQVWHLHFSLTFRTPPLAFPLAFTYLCFSISSCTYLDPARKHNSRLRESFPGPGLCSCHLHFVYFRWDLSWLALTINCGFLAALAPIHKEHSSHFMKVSKILMFIASTHIVFPPWGGISYCSNLPEIFGSAMPHIFSRHGHWVCEGPQGPCLYALHVHLVRFS